MTTKQAPITPRPDLSCGSEWDIPSCAVCGAMMDGFYNGEWLCADHYEKARKGIVQHSLFEGLKEETQ